jgi:hypothetical protein
MPVFLEKFVLPVLAAAVIAVIAINPLKLDWQQRISLSVGVLGLAWFAARTVYLNSRFEPPVNSPVATSPVIAVPTSPTSNQTFGPQSPIIQNNRGSITITNEETKTDPLPSPRK